jgi:hypothetical protein
MQRKQKPQAKKKKQERKQKVSKPKETKAPVASSRSIQNAKPTFKTLSNGDCRVHHREYVQDIASSNTSLQFRLQTLSINPGLLASFPWLSGIAINYESYRFNSLRYIYEPIAPTSTSGSVMMAIEFDSLDDPPNTKQQLMTNRNSVRSAPWARVPMNTTQEDLNKRKSYFVRPDVPPAESDVRLYDTGYLMVASQAVAGISVPLGEIYVEYDITLMTPCTTIFNQLLTASKAVTGGRFIGNGVGTSAAPLKTPVIRSTFNSGVDWDDATNQLIVFNPGFYYIVCSGGGIPNFVASAIDVKTGVAVLSNVNTVTSGSGTSTIDFWSVHVVSAPCQMYYHWLAPATPSSPRFYVFKAPDFMYAAVKPSEKKEENKQLLEQ